MKTRTALLSVYRKDGIVEFAKELVALGWEILASGGTAKTLTGAGVPVKDVAELVGGGAILGHRVVTLSREVHAGLLATTSDADINELEALGIPFIGLACVDLYPLEDEIANPKSNTASVIEKTDIGGPTMIRSAAKGRRIVVADPSDRQAVLDWLKGGEEESEAFVNALAAKAEFIVANYCLASARYHGHGDYDGMVGVRTQVCGYGENAWQTPAGLYSRKTSDPLALDKFELVQGTAPSYNNLCDLDRLLQTITHIAAAFEINGKEPMNVPDIAIGGKHGNPCGAATGTKTDVLRKMVTGDTRAIFGGLVITNFTLKEEDVETLLTHAQSSVGSRRLLDGVIVPEITHDALKMLTRKGDKCRVFVNPALAELGLHTLDQQSRLRYVRGGFLAQPNYSFVLNLNDPSIEKFGRTLEPEEEGSLLIAWGVGSTSNSNTITLVNNHRLIGNGVGQQDRVGAVELAIRRAKDAGHEEEIERAVAYSDSFFPFPDAPKALGMAGVKVILASSGSVKDDATKQACEEQGVSLLLIPDKMGRGFFGH
jgi:phosphoribosylaminoimidazolecarboxamide formyltransferase/IMP cyclohydrolase